VDITPEYKVTPTTLRYRNEGEEPLTEAAVSTAPGIALVCLRLGVQQREEGRTGLCASFPK
jgi:hypothetical protein